MEIISIEKSFVLLGPELYSKQAARFPCPLETNRQLGRGQKDKSFNAKIILRVSAYSH